MKGKTIKKTFSEELDANCNLYTNFAKHLKPGCTKKERQQLTNSLEKDVPNLKKKEM